MYAMTSRSGANRETSEHGCPGTDSYSLSSTTSPSVTTALSVVSLQTRDYREQDNRCLTLDGCQARPVAIVGRAGRVACLAPGACQRSQAPPEPGTCPRS